MRSLLIAGVFPATLPGAALAQQTSQPYYHGPHMWGGGYGWFMGPIMMILTIAAAVAVVILLVRWFGKPSHGSGQTSNSALDILKERFARGEIDKEEFEERRKVLG